MMVLEISSVFRVVCAVISVCLFVVAGVVLLVVDKRFGSKSFGMFQKVLLMICSFVCVVAGCVLIFVCIFSMHGQK